MKETLNWLNGKPLNEADPSWGVNRALFYGESVFTTVFLKEAKALFLNDHLKRLVKQVKNFYFPKTQDFDDIKLQKAITEDIQRINFAHFNQARLRITLFFNDANFILNDLNRLITISPITKAIDEIHAKSYCINELETRRFKLGNYASMFFLKRKLSDPWNDLCLTSSQNKVLELVSSNIFFVDNKDVYFPEYQKDFLEGIVFKHMKLALRNKFNIKNSTITLNDLSNFDSCMATNSIQSIVPVKKIDQYDFKNSCLPEIQKLWSDYVQEVN